VLGEHGYASTQSFVETTKERSYLFYKRFDRLPKNGKRHFVSIGAIYRGLIGTSWRNWIVTSQRLESDKRLTRGCAQRVNDIFAYGCLIGNTDMHAGNLSFYVEPDCLSGAPMTLAPVYDMLPMHWQPSPYLRDMPEYTGFEPDVQSLGNSQAVSMALCFWQSVAGCDDVSNAMKSIASHMKERIHKAERHQVYVRQKCEAKRY